LQRDAVLVVYLGRVYLQAELYLGVLRHDDDIACEAVFCILSSHKGRGTGKLLCGGVAIGDRPAILSGRGGLDWRTPRDQGVTGALKVIVQLIRLVL